MPRRNSPPKRRPEPDQKYNNIHVTMFMNRMMYGGKRSTAAKILYETFDILEERIKQDPVEIFEQALRNVTPSVEVKARRVGGSTYQVPIDVPHDRAISLAMRWILQNARNGSGRGMSMKLANELADAYNGQGNSVKKKDDTHRMAEANRAFAHFR